MSLSVAHHARLLAVPRTLACEAAGHAACAPFPARAPGGPLRPRSCAWRSRAWPESESSSAPQPTDGTTTRHIAFTAVGAVAIAIWPALVGRRAFRHSAVLSIRGSATVFIALLAWFAAEACLGGSQLGTSERVATAIQICWPFVVLAARTMTASP